MFCYFVKIPGTRFSNLLLSVLISDETLLLVMDILRKCSRKTYQTVPDIFTEARNILKLRKIITRERSERNCSFSRAQRKKVTGISWRQTITPGTFW